MSGAGENPFAEPDDDDGTVIVPREAFSALSARRQAQANTEGGGNHGEPRPTGPAEIADFAVLPPVGSDPILTAAQPLLALMARLRNVVSVPEPGALRERAVAELRRFEAALREARVPPEHLRLGHYALCTSLDDVVQCTPWGSHGPWAEISLASAFHKDVRGGERFFEILEKLLATPARYLALIELMYLCMSLGMHGRYRLSPRGPAELDRLREQTYSAIRAMREAPPRRALAPLARAGRTLPPAALRDPALARHRDRAGPARACLRPGAVRAGGRHRPGVRARRHPAAARHAADRAGRPGGRAHRAAAAGPAHATAPRAGRRHRPRPHLGGGHRARADPAAAESDGMFEVGQAEIEQRYRSTMEHIGEVLAGLHGVVQVVGYTDGQPIHTVAFPSNYELSLARARAAGRLLGEHIAPATITAVGRGAQSPRASNADLAGRAANRRVEIIVESTGAP